MRVQDLSGKRVVIWGTGREALAAAALVRGAAPDTTLIFVDENDRQSPDVCAAFGSLVTGAAAISATLDAADIVIKSPGVSLYHPLILKLKKRGGAVTSLLNMWFAARGGAAKTVCVTGTKGKSTVSAIIAHILNGLGHPCVLAGNIGRALGTQDDAGAAYIVVEMSSYQAADFDQTCDIAVLTALYPEHLDWHGSLERYYLDKTNLLTHARKSVVNAQCVPVMRGLGVSVGPVAAANVAAGFHARDGAIFDGVTPLPVPENAHLRRAHNLENICTALTAIRQLGLDAVQALGTLHDFQGLPHRQQELGVKENILYVDDSISTTPWSAIAAMAHYSGKPVTLIAGGHDRGIDYAPLVDYIDEKNVHAVICMGPSGERIHDALAARKKSNLFLSADMHTAAGLAKSVTPSGGVVLLSPAAPSYGLFRDFAERGEAFAKECGFSVYENNGS